VSAVVRLGVNDRGSSNLAILKSIYGRMQRRNSVFEVLRVKRLADIQDNIACKGVCVNEKA